MASQVHISLAGANGMRVSWKTEGDKPNNATVMFAVDFTKDIGTRVEAERSIQYLAQQGGHGYHHTAKLQGLLPGTTYQYRIVVDGVTSAMRTFKNAATGMSKATFLVLGDMGYGENGEAVASRRRMEALKGNADVILHAGDIGYADDSFLHGDGCHLGFCYETVYDNYMNWMENVTDSKPYMTAVGNHESECHSPACQVSPDIKHSLSNFTAYNARWAMPSQESGGVGNMWYSFDYASVHFVFVNTETDFHDAPEENAGDGGGMLGAPAGHFAADGEYLRWLEADLKAANSNRAQQPWIIAVGHRPWVTQDGVSSDDAVRVAHATLFETYGVNLYFAGHVHSYHRLLPVNGNKGVPTIVSGGAGCDEFASDKKTSGSFNKRGNNSLWDYRYYNGDTQLGMLEVTPTELTFKAIASSTGEIIDTVTITAKDRDASSIYV